jgi:transposase-like protein
MQRKAIGRPSKHPEAFKIMVVGKIKSGEMTYQKASKTFGIPEGTVGLWARSYGDDLTPKKRNIDTDRTLLQRAEVEIKELKSEIADLFLQNQMLKKALGCAIEKRKRNTSVITSENLDQFRGDVK